LPKGTLSGNQLGVTTARACYGKTCTFFPFASCSREGSGVPLTVSESWVAKEVAGYLRRSPVMAAETQAVFLIGIGHIFLSREFLDRKLCVLRAVGVVAWGTALVFYRAHCEFRHIPPYDLLMAAQTRSFPVAIKSFSVSLAWGNGRKRIPSRSFMGAWTTFAFSTFSATFRWHWAQSFSPSAESSFLWGAPCGLWQEVTSAQQGRMDALPLHHSLHIKMAGEAQLAALLEQQPLVLRLMGRVAVGAIPCRDRTMEIFEVHLVRMGRSDRGP